MAPSAFFGRGTLWPHTAWIQGSLFRLLLVAGRFGDLRDADSRLDAIIDSFDLMQEKG